jgi:hypothetical protein
MGFIFMFLSTVLAWCAIGSYLCSFIQFGIMCCGLLFVFICKVLAWCAVSVYLCSPLEFWHGMPSVDSGVYVYSFSVACCGFSRISQSNRSSSIIGHADSCVVSSSG